MKKSNVEKKEENRILELSNITKMFSGVKALDQANLDLKRGEVHVLIGENGAGKSTLMKILLGLYQSDSGKIYFKGRKEFFKSPHEALLNGISMIHQELCLVPSMTIYENIWMGREKKFRRCGLIDNNERRKRAKELLELLEISLDPDAMVSTLSVAEMQLVEIVRAISYDSEIIIMDEPTSALSESEIELLYKIVHKLSKKGTAIIFMSHKLDEVFTVADRISVLRDGRTIGTYFVDEITEEELVRLIVGREMTDMYSKQQVKIGETALEVENLSRKGVFDQINFKVRKGEILGFYGLIGAKRTETMRTVFGVDRKTSGTVRLFGKKIMIDSPRDAIRQGLAMVTEDRLRSGAIFTMSIEGNATLANFKKICNKLAFYSPSNEHRIFAAISEQLKIKYGKAEDMIGTLSGGNQQKVMIARWLLTNPSVLILDEPTRGIDVGAKSEIYKLINLLAEKGMAIIMVSSEMPEIISMCDRIIVMREGRIAGEISGKEATQEVLASLVFDVEEEESKDEYQKV